MKDFFEILSEFLESDLAKSYGWIILVSFVICVVIIVSAIWFLVDKFIIPQKLFKAERIEETNKKLVEENETLKAENSELKSKLLRYKYIEKNEDESSKEFVDKAVYNFAIDKNNAI